MDQKKPTIDIICDKCGCSNLKIVRPVEGFTGTYLWSFWCKDCHQPNVVRYQQDETTGVWALVERLIPSDIYIQREPEPGITIKPKATKHRNK